MRREGKGKSEGRAANTVELNLISSHGISEEQLVVAR